MIKRFAQLLPALMLLTAGCHSDSARATSEPVAEAPSKGVHVVDYATSDPRLEPTLRVGGLLEIRTTNGSPVVLQSQIDRQRKAAEQLRTNAETIAPATITPGDAKQ